MGNVLYPLFPRERVRADFDNDGSGAGHRFN